MNIFRNLAILFVAFNVFLLCSAVESQDAKPVETKEKSDMKTSSSVPVADYHIQSVIAPRTKDSAKPSQKYGYPYNIAPTLTPVIHSRSDDYENEAVHVPSVPSVGPVSPGKSFSSHLPGSNEHETPAKKSRKKQKNPYVYGATRRHSYDSEEDNSSEKRLSSYREPTYRNFDELESMFMPRMDTGFVFVDYRYSPKGSHPVVSPVDPYLSPSAGPTDTFYPTVPKIKSFSTYGSHGSPLSQPNYSPGSPLTYGSYDKSYTSGGGHYDYNDGYTIESNKPIIGDIRKRLLDYAGAADMYEGEPDYLREVARNKHKYGNIGNYYYPYGGPGNRDSFRDYPYEEIKFFKKARHQ